MKALVRASVVRPETTPFRKLEAVFSRPSEELSGW